MPDYTTTALLASIRRRASVPNSSALGTNDSALLAIASEELRGQVTALLKSVREEHLVETYDVPLSAGVAAYRIPPRAVGGALRDAVVVQSDGALRNLRWLDRADLPALSTAPGQPRRFYFEADRLVVHPTPEGNGETLRLPYIRRCGSLVATSAVAVITAIDTGTGALTLSAAIPATFTTSQTFDFVAAQPGFRTLAMDLTASVASGTGMTFAAADLPTDLAVGDYVCLAGESPVPQIPVELHDLLAQAAAVEVLAGPFGDLEALPRAESKLERLKSEALDILAPRNEGEPVPWISGAAFFGGYE